MTAVHRRSILFALFFFASSAFSDEHTPCETHLKPRPSIENDLIQKTEQELQRQGVSSHQTRGYAILISTMVASAAATTYLSSSLPPNMQFLSHFLAQASTLGVYTFGAPIWEPLASRFRKKAFGVKQATPLTVTSADMTQQFELLWGKTQELYSLNAQMSRNLMTQFILTVRQNFFEAYQAMNSGEVTYAADQIAEAAYRLRSHFREIEPHDQALLSVVKTTFLNHVEVDETFVLLVKARIQNLDPHDSNSSAQDFYSQILYHWLNWRDL